MSGRVTRADWGGQPALRLESEALSLLVVPGLGGRVVSLLDRRTGREWLAQDVPPTEGEASAWAGETVVFGGRESWGWDECLPTVAPCADPADAAAPPLRDHGDQWGRAADARPDEGAGSVEVTWTTSRWPLAFSRRIRLEDEANVLAEYTLVSLAAAPLPVLWSMHPVLRLEPGTRLELPGVEEVRLTWVNGAPLAPAERVGWPVAPRDDGAAMDLSLVRGEEGWAAKLYAGAPPAARAVCPDGASLELTWDRGLAPSVGIWLSFGGWPPGGPPNEQVAIEPTTSPDDDLADALAHDRALWLAPGERRRWWVRLALLPPA